MTEVPLLFEVGAEERFDRVVVITAPTALREQRRRVARDDRDSRLLPDREKVRRADYHYVNTGTFEELYRVGGRGHGGARGGGGARGVRRVRARRAARLAAVGRRAASGS